MNSWRVPQAPDPTSSSAQPTQAVGSRTKPKSVDNSNLQPLIGQGGSDILYPEGGGRISHLGPPSHRSCCRAP